MTIYGNYVSPAPAGMIPAALLATVSSIREPRTRGDDPVINAFLAATDM